ncbi:MAG: Stp1/IreP family PP2C-type Ser/Thr phosphatase [Bdellovibrionales bacterium]|nr:Stp1/IreP family PP2C-type Ser/Thr phosphatase [Bdellovibrionales bacterium]
METTTQDTEVSILPYLTHAALSDVGQKREENQDSYGILESDSAKFFVVADGMGGVKGGAIASQLAIQVFENSIDFSNLTPEVMVSAVISANRAIFQKGQEDGELAGMGTTFLALSFAGAKLHVLHVGDSRAYRFRNGRVEQLTHDHTLIQELVDSGALSEEQAEDHPVSHMLTRSLGPAEEVLPDCLQMLDGPIAGDRYLLCSDGLYNLVKMHELPHFLEGKSDYEAAQVLIDEANKRGGTDNITAIIITVSNDYPITLDDLPESVRRVSSSDDTLELTRSELHSVPYGGSKKFERGDSSGENGVSPAIEAHVNLEEHALEREKNEEEDESELSQQPIESPDVDSENVEYQPAGTPRRGGKALALVSGVAAALTVLAVISYQRGSLDKFIGNEKRSLGAPEHGVHADDDESLGEIKDTSLATSGKELPAQPPTIETPLHVDELLEELRREKQKAGEESSSGVLSFRKEDLEKRAEVLQEQISLLRSPLSGDIGEILKNSPVQRKEREQQLQDVRAKIDIATRKLAVWYGRKRRMENTDPISLSVEVAAVSENVQSTKKDFDRITWEYLKQAEAYRYDPENQELKSDLLALRKQRQAQLQLLSEVIQEAIAEEIFKSDEEISKLTLERDEVEGEVRSITRAEGVAKVIASGDTQSQTALLTELESELDVVNLELRELESHSSSNASPKGAEAPDRAPDSSKQAEAALQQ